MGKECVRAADSLIRMSMPPPSPPSRMPQTLASKLMFIAVCAVPFQQAFTIPVGFPLKLSEIAEMLAVVPIS